MSSSENPAQLVAHQLVLLMFASLVEDLIMSETWVKSPSSPWPKMPLCVGCSVPPATAEFGIRHSNLHAGGRRVGIVGDSGRGRVHVPVRLEVERPAGVAVRRCSGSRGRS